MSAGGRVALAIILSVGIATLPIGSLRRTVAVAIVCGIALALTRPRARWLIRRLAAASLAIVALSMPWIFSGEPLHALAIAFRGFAVAWIALAIASTIASAELPHALRALGAPQLLASTIHAMIWQLGHVIDEAERLILARRLRGATAIGPGVVSALLVRTRLRADRVELALALRGATETAPASRFRVSDALAVIAAVALLFALHRIH